MDLYDIRNVLNTGKSIYDIPLRVTYYARVSTDKDEQLHSLSAQVRYYTDMIKACSNWTFAEGYVDEGISGTSAKKRDSFMRMISDAKAGHFDFVVTKEISRFSRNTLDSIQYTQELLKYGVGVLFQSDNINTLMPDAELRLTIMSSIAQDEVRKISERVKFGFKRAIESGVVLGNSKIWGYEKQEGRLVIHEREAELVRLIFDLYANQQMGIRTISGYLTEHQYENTRGNPFSFSTIKGILTNPKYKGYYCGGKTHKYDYRHNDRKNMPEAEWVMYKDEENVPPIVSEELWEKANLILAKRSAIQSAEDKTGYQNKYPYSGKLICMEHQLPYYRTQFKYKSGNKEAWQCQEYARKGKAGCLSPILYTSELNEVVRLSLEQLALNQADIIHELVQIYSTIGNESKLKEDMAKCNVEIDTILQRKDKLLDLSIAGHIKDDEFSLRNQRFNDEIERLRQRLSELETEELKNHDMVQSVELLRQVIARELNFEQGFSVGVVDALLEKIEVCCTEDKHAVCIKVYLKALNDTQSYLIQRKRGSTSIGTSNHGNGGAFCTA